MGGVDTFRRRNAYYSGLERTERPAHFLLLSTVIVSLLLTPLLCGLIAWAFLDCEMCLNALPTATPLDLEDGGVDELLNVTEAPPVRAEEEQPRAGGYRLADPDAPRPGELSLIERWDEEVNEQRTPLPAAPTPRAPATLCAPYDQGGRISDDVLRSLGSWLWLADTTRLPTGILGLNLQARVNKSNTEDRAKERLFSGGKLDLRATSDTYSSFIALLDNYQANLRRDDAVVKDWGEKEEAEVFLFLNDVQDTYIMQKLDSFLINYGYLGGECTLRQRLYELWFVRYPRSARYSVNDSSGFEHVFVGETKKTVASGLHSWIRLYGLEQIADPSIFDYRGYITADTPHVLDVQFNYLDQPKSSGSMFLGTSPEFDLAVYTLCLIARTNEKCPISLGGQDLMVQTFDMNRVPGLQISTAYPIPQ